jgi:hypothetical protein
LIIRDKKIGKKKREIRIVYLEKESIEKEANGREEESEERKKVEIFISRVRFMVKVNGIESVNPIIHHNYEY